MLAMEDIVKVGKMLYIIINRSNKRASIKKKKK